MRAASQIRPFDFSKLPKLNSQEVALRRSLLEAYPIFSQDNTEENLQNFFKRLSGGLPFQIRGKFVQMEEQSLGEFAQGLPKHCFVFQFKGEPHSQNLWLHLEAPLAETILAQLLGEVSGVSKNELPSIHFSRPFNEVDQAALEFLAVNLLQAFDSLGDNQTLLGPNRLAFQAVWGEGNFPQNTQERGLNLKFYVGFVASDGTSAKGYATLHLPHPWLSGVLLREDILTGLRMSQADQNSQEQGLSRISHAELELTAELGQVSLKPSDWQQLEAGDVVLFDETQAKLGSHGLGGKIVLKVPGQVSLGLLAELIEAQDKLTVKLLDFYGGSS